MGVFLVNQRKGRDNVIDPFYVKTNGIGGASEEVIENLARSVQELKDIVQGKDGQDGLEQKVQQLEEAVAQIETTVDVYYDTKENWDAQPALVGELGKIYVYSNAKEYQGQLLPRIKIGNGESLLKDMYYMDQDIENAIKSIINITDEDIDNWNNKVSVEIDDEQETLTFVK